MRLPDRHDHEPVSEARREISGMLREASLEKINIEILADKDTSESSANAICAA
jgi:hypothetical protein